MALVGLKRSFYYDCDYGASANSALIELNTPATKFLNARENRLVLAISPVRSGVDPPAGIFVGGPPGVGFLIPFDFITLASLPEQLLVYRYSEFGGMMRGEVWVRGGPIFDKQLAVSESWCLCETPDQYRRRCG